MPTLVSGGYVINRSPMIRSGIHAHTSALDRPISQLDIDALNAVQATGWRINERVLDVMTDAWTRKIWNEGIELAGMSEAVLNPLPERMEDDVWAALDPDSKKKYLQERGEIHGENMAARGRQQALLDCLSVARLMRHYPVIYYPHSRCFRGRIHPIPAVGPQPQGHDLSKSLLTFSRGEALGPDGLYWLCVRLANCAGHDKLPLEERVEWAFHNRDRIIATAGSPLEHIWWGELKPDGDPVLDEPWGALATIFELAEAFQMEDPDEFISYLPCPMDGACNGIQHLSAMGLDPVGARATNLCAGLDRQDIYEEVAEAVRHQVARDSLDGKAEALAWQGKVTRDTTKRPTMTLAYGVTSSGIRKQLLEAGVPDEDGLEGPNADYLRDAILTSLETTVVAARTIMAWLQTTANTLAKAGLPYEFKTPTGSWVRQAYHVVSSERVETLCGKLRMDEEITDGPLNPRKCALAASPNTIHAFDASHLALTVKEAVEDGIGSFAMIHDSYGTHAGRTTDLAIILRRTFVSIYQTDWLAEIRDHIMTYAPNVELPEIPERGTFDLDEVLEAKFFFS